MIESLKLKGQEIGILGCGWLGLALAQLLLKSGAAVSGSTTSPGKLALFAEHGINPFLIDLRSETPISDGFMRVKTLVVASPPKAENGDYVNQLKRLAAAIANSGIEHIVFVSSTGVYPENSGTVLETDAAPHSDRAKLLLQAEEIMRQINTIAATVVRFGGLFGPGRHPGKFLSGKTNLPNGNAPVNFIHQADAVKLIQEIITQNNRGEIYNACAELHPSRKEFYTKAAALAGLPLPEFNNQNQANPTLVNSSKIQQALSYSFVFPDPLAALDSLTAATISNTHP